MKLAVGSDHAGFALKRKVVEKLRFWNHEVTDVGTHSTDPVDFPDIAEAVCGHVMSGAADKGILVCGTGVGAAIAANKFPGIRAAVCHDIFSAHQCVEHDDVNVLCLGAWIIGEMLAYDLVRAFLDARHDSNEAFRRRLEKVKVIEQRFRGAQ